MKYIKTFENNSPNVGDYVVVYKPIFDDDISVPVHFVIELGCILEINNKNHYPYRIQYFDSIEEIHNTIMFVPKGRILYFSSDKEKAEKYLEMADNIKKYNL